MKKIKGVLKLPIPKFTLGKVYLFVKLIDTEGGRKQDNISFIDIVGGSEKAFPLPANYLSIRLQYAQPHVSPLQR